jgi:hypothetical protein
MRSCLDLAAILAICSWMRRTGISKVSAFGSCCMGMLLGFESG